MLDPIDIDPGTFLKDHCTLPALPLVVNQLQEKLLDENTDMKEIADLIGNDAAILAQVLKVVNSAYYGLPTEITRIRMAVAYLGLHEIYRMVVSLAVVNTLDIKQKKELDAFWFHSFFTARCARYLAKKYEPLLSYEDLWPGAMLHDIGKLVYLRFFPDQYTAMSAFANEKGITFHQAENHFGYPESAYLGGLLCTHWRLPSQARMGCAFHTLEDVRTGKEEGDIKPMERIVGVANLVAVLSADPLNQETKDAITAAICLRLECEEEEFLPLMGDIYQIKAEVEEFMKQFA